MHKASNRVAPCAHLQIYIHDVWIHYFQMQSLLHPTHSGITGNGIVDDPDDKGEALKTGNVLKPKKTVFLFVLFSV